MIRRAVGALVKHNGRYLLVHKVKAGSKEIPGQWCFPMGGVEPSDRSESSAILRELLEETGSQDYKIISKLEKALVFEIPKDLTDVIDFDSQETTFFLVEFYGKENQLESHDEEVSEMVFLEPKDVLSHLTHSESRVFFSEFINTNSF